MKRFVPPSDLIDLVSAKIRDADIAFKDELNNLILQNVINTFQQSPMYHQNQQLMQYVHTRPNIFSDHDKIKKIAIVNKRSSDFNRPMVGQLFYDYWRKFRNHREQIELNDETDFSYKLTDSDFEIANGPPPWNLYQEWIDQLGLTLRLRVPSLDDEHYSGVSIEKEDVDQPIDPSQLSSGELVYLNIALSTLVTKDGMLAVSPPNVLLLDEPDAHLHPALCHELIHKILVPLTIEQKIRIIMTTHSPTTVSVGPSGSIYEKLNLAGLEKRDRQHAVNALMYGLSHVSLDPHGRRQVFVESKYDQKNYSIIYDIVHHELSSKRSLSFISCGLNSGGDERNAGKDKVKEFVSRLREAGNKSAFGLVDFDNEYQKEEGIFTLSDQAYGIENVVLNPFAIGMLLLKAKPGEINGITFTKAPTIEGYRTAIIEHIERNLSISIEDRTSINTIGGFEISLSTESIKMQCHQYEKLVFECLPELRRYAQRPCDLVSAVVREVFIEHPSIIPMWFSNTFKSLLDWENAEGERQ